PSGGVLREREITRRGIDEPVFPHLVERRVSLDVSRDALEPRVNLFIGDPEVPHLVASRDPRVVARDPVEPRANLSTGVPPHEVTRKGEQWEFSVAGPLKDRVEQRARVFARQPLLLIHGRSPIRLIFTAPPTMVVTARPVTFQPSNGVLRLLDL